MSEEIKAKIVTDRPGRPKGVLILGTSIRPDKGVEILPTRGKEVEILDSRTEQIPKPPEVTIGEGDREEV